MWIREDLSATKTIDKVVKGVQGLVIDEVETRVEEIVEITFRGEVQGTSNSQTTDPKLPQQTRSQSNRQRLLKKRPPPRPQSESE